MPIVTLKPNWPSTFRRTVEVEGRKEVIVFEPGQGVDVSPEVVEQLRPDMGRALLPATLDEKLRLRPITDEVVPDVPVEQSTEQETEQRHSRKRK